MESESSVLPAFLATDDYVPGAFRDLLRCADLADGRFDFPQVLRRPFCVGEICFGGVAQHHVRYFVKQRFVR